MRRPSVRGLVGFWRRRRPLALLLIALAWALFITIVHVAVNRRDSLAVLIGKGTAAPLSVAALPVT